MSVDELAPLAGHGTAPPRDHSAREYTEHHVEPGFDDCNKWFGIKSKRAIVRLTVLLVIAVALGFAAYAVYSGIEALVTGDSSSDDGDDGDDYTQSGDDSDDYFSGDSHENDGYAKNTQSIGSMPGLGGDLDDEVQVDFAPGSEPDPSGKMGSRAHGDGHGEGATDYISSTVAGASTRDYGEDMDDQIDADFELLDPETDSKERDGDENGEGAEDYVDSIVADTSARDYGEDVDDQPDLVARAEEAQIGSEEGRSESWQLRGNERKKR